MEERRFFLVLDEVELASLDLALDKLVEDALKAQRVQNAKTLLAIQLQCQHRREAKPAGRSDASVGPNSTGGTASAK